MKISLALCLWDPLRAWGGAIAVLLAEDGQAEALAGRVEPELRRLFDIKKP